VVLNQAQAQPHLQALNSKKRPQEIFRSLYKLAHIMKDKNKNGGEGNTDRG